jgi:acyl-CoA reductase-like NAD-dependent aldehyde dehydrogenase
VGDVTIPRTDPFIDGDWRLATGSRVDEIVDPATEVVLATVRQGSTEDRDAARAAARRAFHTA